METMKDFMDQIDASLRNLERGDLVEGKVIAIQNDSIIVDIQFSQDGVIYESELVNPVTDYKENDQVNIIVIGFSKEGQVILSEAKAQRQFGEAMIEKAISNGDSVTGKLKSIAKGGFRVDVSGVEGYLPFSLYQSSYLNEPEALLGTSTELKVEKSDNRGVVFTRMPIEKALFDKAKQKFYAAHGKGDIVEGKLLHFNRGGVVVDVDGMRGFIPRSEVSYSRATKAEDLISEGDVLRCVIRELSEKDEKLLLSLKDLIEDPWSRIDEEVAIGDIFEVYPNGENQSLYFYELVDGVQGTLFKKEVPDEVRNSDEPHVLEVIGIDKARRRVDLSYYFELENFEDDLEEEESNTLGNIFGDALKGLKFDE